MIHNERSIISSILGKNKTLFVGVISAILVSNCLNVMLPLSIGKFYEIVLHQSTTKARLMSLLPLNISSSQQFFIFLGCLIALKGIISYFENFWIGLVGERFARDIREMTFQRQLRHSMQSHRVRPVGKYLLRYSGDLMAIQNFISKGILVFTGDVFFVSAGFIVLWFLHPMLTIIGFSCFLISGIVIYFFSERLRRATLNRRNQRSVNLSFVSARMQSFYTIKSFNLENPENKRFVKKSGTLYRLGVKYYRLYSLIRSMLPVFFFGSLMMILYTMEYMRTKNINTISRADIFVFLLLFLYMQSVMRRLLRVNIIWQSGRISMRKLISIINIPLEERTDNPPAKLFNGAITFQNVSFAYTEGHPLLNNISFRLEPNSITQIKGGQGCGKSTLIKLIQNVYELQQGNIILDEFDLRDLTPFEIRRNCTVISDEAALMGSTIFRAISYRNTLEKREKASRIIKKLDLQLGTDTSDILDYKLEDHARNLSSGEKTMVQFARALLTEKKIILLDEPFIHLNQHYCDIMVEVLNELKKKRAIVLVSNNPPAGLNIDKTIEI